MYNRRKYSPGQMEQINWKHNRPEQRYSKRIGLVRVMDIIQQRKIIIQPCYTQSLIRKLSLKSCDFVTSCLNSTKEMKPEPLRSVSSRTFRTTSICKADQSRVNSRRTIVKFTRVHLLRLQLVLALRPLGLLRLVSEGGHSLVNVVFVQLPVSTN